jgi:hypothetical protein
MPTALTAPNETGQNAGHVDVLLTNFSIAYSQDNSMFWAGRAGPVVPVVHASDKYVVWPRGAFFRDDVQVRPMGGRPPVINVSAQTDTYTCEERALSAVLDDRERANATNPINPEKAKVRALVSQHLINRDRRLAAAIIKTGLWTGTVGSGDITGVAAGPTADQEIQWDQAAADPIKQIRKRRTAMQRKVGYKPNTMIVGVDAHNALMDNPQIIARISGGATTGAPALADEELLRRAFNIERYILAESVYNSANEGAAEAMGFIANSKAALLCYSDPSANTLDVATAFTCMSWTGLLPAAFDAPAAVYRFRDEEAFTDKFTVRMAWDVKVTAPDLGAYFTGIVA